MLGFVQPKQIGNLDWNDWSRFKDWIIWLTFVESPKVDQILHGRSISNLERPTSIYMTLQEPYYFNLLLLLFANANKMSMHVIWASHQHLKPIY